MHVYAAISSLGFQQLVHNFLYRKPVWAQKIKDPNPLPFTAASWKANTTIRELVGGAR